MMYSVIGSPPLKGDFQSIVIEVESAYELFGIEGYTGTVAALIAKSGD